MLSCAKKISYVLTRIANPAANITSPSIINFSTTLPINSQPIDAEESDARENRELTLAELKKAKNDRSKLVPVEVSIKYIKSSAYQQTYGEQFVWEQYRRNHKGLHPPKKTRKTCIRNNIVSTGNPCPICRDEYLVLDYRNTDLLKQFISPYTGEVLSYSKTGLCQKKHLQLMVAVERAKDCGLIEYDVPFREYVYSEYYAKQGESKEL